MKRIGLALVGILLFVLLLLQHPSVQNKIFTRFLLYLSEKTQFTLQHEYVRYKWLNELDLKGFSIQDQNNQQLCAIQSLKIKLNPIQLLIKPRITINQIQLDGAKICFIKNPQDHTFNIEKLVERLTNPEPNKKKHPTKMPHWLFKQIALAHITFVLDDQTKPRLVEGLDQHHMTVEQIDIALQHVAIDSRGVSGRVKQIAGFYVEQQLHLDHLHVDCKLMPTELQLLGIHLQTRHSSLQGSIRVKYPDISQISQSNWFEQIQGIADLKAVKLDTRELSGFIPNLKDYDTQYCFNGQVTGRANDFAIEDFSLAFGQQESVLKGRANFTNLLNWPDSFFTVNLIPSRFYIADILPYLPSKYSKQLKRVKVCHIQGDCFGTPQNFISQADFNTNVGKIGAQLAITMDKDFSAMTYQGALTTDQLAIGQLLAIDQLQHLTMYAQVNGEQSTDGGLTAQVKADIEQLGWHDYTYTQIHTDGRFEKDFFKGNVAVSDPNLSLQANATIDWRDAAKKLDIKGKLAQAHFKALKLVDQQAYLSTDISVAMSGRSWDDLNSHAIFKHIDFKWANQPLYLDEFEVINTHQTNDNQFKIKSDLFTMEASGGSTYTALFHDWQQFIKTYQHALLLKNDFKPTYTKQPYKFTYAIYLKDINPLFQVLLPNTDAYITPNAAIKGSFEQNNEVAFLLELPQVNALQWKGIHWEHTGLTIDASQQKDGTDLFAAGQLISDQQQWDNQYTTNNLLFDVAWYKDQITFKHHLADPEQPNHLALNGVADLYKDKIQVKFNQVAIQINGCKWQLDQANLIQLTANEFKSQNLNFTYEDQKISISGQWDWQQVMDLQLKLEYFALDQFNPLTNQKLQGIANGSIAIGGNKQDLRVNSDLHIQDIKVGDMAVGDLQANTKWNGEKQQLNIACHIMHEQKPTVDIKGSYRPSASKQLSLDARFSQAQLAIIEPFASGLFTDLTGILNGQVHIHGRLASPQLQGKLQLTDGTIRINYTNVLYHCDGTLFLNEKSIYTHALNLSDDQAGTATVSGGVYYNGANDFELDLKAKLNNCKGLETDWEHNHDFYGIGIASGNISLHGPIGNLAMHIQATTKAGTNMTIPIQKYGKQVGQEDYIHFIDFKAPKQESVAETNKIKLKGFSLNMELVITPDAGVSIVLNADNKDTIQGKGKGNLGLTIDQEGSFSMSGHYELVAGKYTFSLYNMIRKQFKILAGSTITWYDKPYEGVLNVKAAYDQRVSLSPLLTDKPVEESNQEASKQETNSATDKYPVAVIMALQGNLTKPAINFEFEFKERPNNPDLQAAIDNFLSRTATDEPYLLNQVFSLVVFKRFFSESLLSSSSGTLGRSVGEIFSQQLTDFAGQLDENLEIDTDIDLSDLKKGARLKLGYNLLGGKVKVSTDRVVNLKDGQKTNISNLIGDVAIETILTSDKRWRLKLYSKRMRKAEVTDDTVIAGGMSILYVKSFNVWSALFGWHRRARKEKPNNTTIEASKD